MHSKHMQPEKFVYFADLKALGEWMEKCATDGNTYDANATNVECVRLTLTNIFH